MAASFSATQISCMEEDGVLSVAFGGEATGSSDAPYVLLSRTLAPDAQDAKLGQDSAYLELSDQSKSVYGGIIAVQLSPRQMEVALSACGAKLIGDSEIRVSLPQSVEYARLEQALRRILDGTEFITRAA